MKILLTAPIRTRSKWVANNIYMYLKQNDDTHNFWPLSDIITHISENKLFISNRIDFNGYNLIETNYSALPIDEEIKNRIDWVKQSPMSMCIKVHPTMPKELSAIDYLKTFCDLYFTLTRKDLFEQCLSAVLSFKTNKWVANEAQVQTISDLTNSPIIIPVDFWKKVLHNLQQQNDYILNEIPNKRIYMEDTLTIRDSKDFCNILDLEYREFSLNQSNSMEFGNHKKQMILNYNELRTTYDEFINR